MYLKTKGLVLRVSPYNDSDAMLTILTGEQGRISAKVRNLRRKNSPLAAPCQLLAFAEFTLFDYKGVYTVNEAHTIELFTDLRKDLQKLSMGTYFAQVGEVVSQEDFPTPEFLSLLLNCLYALCKLEIPEEKVKAVFELRSACLAGYTPDLYGCHICGDPNGVFMDISAGQLQCAVCRNPGSGHIRLPLTAGILDAMRYICHCEPSKIFSFTLPAESVSMLSNITESYLSTQLERGFSALDFYKSLLFQPDSLI